MSFTISGTVDSQPLQVSARVDFKACGVGEFYAIASGTCVSCYNGTYSLADNSNLTVTKCSSCASTTGVTHCYADKMFLSQGYWRVTPNANSVTVCPFGSKACVGGSAAGSPDSCSAGYVGPLCAVCADGYRKSGLGKQCNLCKEKDALTTLVAILLALVLALIVWRFLDMGAEYLHLDVTELFTSSRPAAATVEVASNPGLLFRCGSLAIYLARLLLQFTKNLLTSMQLKVLFTFTQIFSNFLYMFQVAVADPFMTFVSFFGWINFNFMDRVGLSCNYRWDHVTILQVTTLVPIGVAVILLAGYAISKSSIRRRGHVRNFDIERVLVMSRAQYTSLFLLLTYLVLPGVSVVIFNSFPCVDTDPDGVSGLYSKYLLVDLSISCHSNRYTLGVIWAAVAIFVYPVGIPLLYFYLLHRVRHRIRDDALFQLEQEEQDNGYNSRSQMAVQDAVKQLRFLYAAYKPMRWYWEVCMCACVGRPADVLQE